MIDMVFLLLIFFIVNATAIIVKTDPEVKPPIAKNAQLQVNKEGRIVVNVRNDGTYTAEDFTILPDEEAIKDYVKKARDKVEALSITPRLHLRGDKEALFKHGRVAVRAAAAAGVNQVLFATFIREP
jgi:biopolymer transport protein ExbD